MAYNAEPQVTNGMDEKHFGPKSTVNRGQCVTFLYRTLNSGKDGLGGEAKEWAGKSYGGDPFGVDIDVDNSVGCPYWCTVQFLF